MALKWSPESTGFSLLLIVVVLSILVYYWEYSSNFWYHRKVVLNFTFTIKPKANNSFLLLIIGASCLPYRALDCVSLSFNYLLPKKKSNVM